MLAVACLVLVQVEALRLAVAWGLLVAQLEVVVALKEDRLIQQHSGKLRHGPQVIIQKSEGVV